MDPFSNSGGIIYPEVDDDIIEAMSVNFEESVDLLDIGPGIDLLGILIADIEPGVGGSQSHFAGNLEEFGSDKNYACKEKHILNKGWL